jgi:hypothetical protein
MRRLKLTVAVSTKLNRGHLVHGEQALILPVLARSDIDMQLGGRQSITLLWPRRCNDSTVRGVNHTRPRTFTGLSI